MRNTHRLLGLALLVLSFLSSGNGECSSDTVQINSKDLATTSELSQYRGTEPVPTPEYFKITCKPDDEEVGSNGYKSVSWEIKHFQIPSIYHRKDFSNGSNHYLPACGDRFCFVIYRTPDVNKSTSRKFLNFSLKQKTFNKTDLMLSHFNLDEFTFRLTGSSQIANATKKSRVKLDIFIDFESSDGHGEIRYTPANPERDIFEPIIIRLKNCKKNDLKSQS